MAEINVKGNVFQVPDRYVQGHEVSLGEAQVLNRYAAARLREAIQNGAVKSRQEAQAFVASQKALEPIDGTDTDLSWEALL